MDKNEKTRHQMKKSYFGIFLLISLLLHLLIVMLFQKQLLLPVQKEKVEQTSVALQERKNWLELDQKLPEKTIEPPKEATHIAEVNAKVDQETAPVGDDSRDKQRAEQAKRQVVQQKQVPAPQKKTPPAAQPPASPPLQAETAGEHSPAVNSDHEKPEDQVPINLPSLSKLTNLSPNTLARIDRQEQKQRIKDRPEIELKEDEVWLNLRQDDKLISFFRRFSDRIEAVWNYPVEASSRGIEGTLLIKIIVNKKGELVDAFPLESSGSEILDYEAITAVYRAAPFGELPSYYKHEQLKIYAHFQYSLSRRMLYGNPK